MALNDKDKEYIKKTVDDAVNKSEKQNEQKITNAIKANNKSNVEQSKKDRQETLEYLNKVGVLTLAEKIELMKNNISKEIKETVNEAIPEDLSKNLKQSFKNAGSNVGKGLGQGVDAVKSLLQGDILGGMGSALSGSINAGVGLAQGAIGAVGSVLSAGGAAASILSAKKERDKRKKAKLQTEDGSYQELPQTDQLDPEENPVMKNASKMVEQKEKPIRKEPEEKTTTGILKKGLGGLSKGLEMANGVLNVLATKQKLILASVGLGVVGILALVGWFANGGFENLLKKYLGKDVDPTNPVHTPAPTKLDEANSYNNLVKDFKDLNVGNVKDQLQNSTTGITGAEKLTGGKLRSKVNKGQPIGISYKSGAMEPYILIKDGEVIAITVNTINKDEFDIEFRVPQADGFGPHFYAKNVVMPLVIKGRKYKRGDIIGYIGKAGRMNYTGNSKSGVTEKDQDFISLVNTARDHNFKEQQAQLDDLLSEKNIKSLQEQYKGLEKQSEFDAFLIDKSPTQKFNLNYEQEHAEYEKKKEQLKNGEDLSKTSDLIEETPSVSVKETSTENTQKAQENTQKLTQSQKSSQDSAQARLFDRMEEKGKEAEQNITVQLQNTPNPDYPATHYSPEQWIRANNNELGL